MGDYVCLNIKNTINFDFVAHDKLDNQRRRKMGSLKYGSREVNSVVSPTLVFYFINCVGI